MQFQIDILGVPVERPVIQETTALGAAYLAGIAVCFWKSKEDIRQYWEHDMTFTQKMETEKQKELYKGWKKTVNATRKFKKNIVVKFCVGSGRAKNGYTKRSYSCGSKK